MKCWPHWSLPVCWDFFLYNDAHRKGRGEEKKSATIQNIRWLYNLFSSQSTSIDYGMSETEKATLMSDPKQPEQDCEAN